MSSINHKKPGFSPLNHRKETVGQTYGERREKTKAAQTQSGLSWLERAKDKFLGTKKARDIKPFSKKEDRFLGTQRTIYSANPFVEKKSRLEEGTHLQPRIARPPTDQYVRFLDSVIHFMNVKKAPKKA